MYSVAVMLIMNALYFTLRISGNTGSFPRPLSAKEEYESLLKTAEGDLEARNKLIEHNLRLVAHVIKKYYSATNDQDDLISIGTIGLIKAISTFNVQKGARLSTYAARCIENEILMYFRTLRRQSCEVSLSEPVDNDSEGNELALMDMISCEDTMLDSIYASDQRKKLTKFVTDRLDPREREIIIMRYGLNNVPPRTQREIAELCGISRSYVSRIEKRALSKLQHAFED
ncbi:MAG: RNA polymerase sporulation sigma factor SigK [Clostridiales bacterium]|nr:RNA polymerase sporulation sigma factor SigK [Clostridiales bacterium]